MRRNCDLELRLDSFSSEDQTMITKDKEIVEESSKQITIFYDGRVCVSHVTELQAKAIIMAARREKKEKEKSISESNKCNPSSSSAPLCMKKSIQRFLQKRNTRLHSSSPYLN